MIFKIITLIILGIFYIIYLFKLINLNRQNIKTNQVGIGTKSSKVKFIENTMSKINVLEIIAQVVSIIIINNTSNIYLICLSIFLGLTSIFFFFMATFTMKNNWRVGIPEEKTNLVNNGIYKWSRNPAFVGFDLLYISTTIMYFNIPLLTTTLLSILMLHLQTLEEEKHMLNTFGKEYEDYKAHTLRYFGRK